MRNKKNQKHLIGWPRVLFAGLVAAAMSVAIAFADDQTPPQVTLSQALEQAFHVSPVLRAHLAELQEAEAGLLGARAYPFNPELEFATADRSGGGTSSTDTGFALSQEIEIGGQRSKRIAVASAFLEGATSRFAREKRLLAAQIEISFADAARARELVRVARADAGVTSNLLDFAERRLNAGAGTEIELNLARSVAGRAESTLRQTEALYEEARSRLAEVIGLDPATAPLPLGDLPDAEVKLPPLSSLLDSALRERADLAALRRGTQAEQAGLRLAKSLAIPNLRIGAFYEKEAGTDNIKGFAIALPIPLFNRNRGEVAELEARVLGSTAEASAAELMIRREVVSLPTLTTRPRLDRHRAFATW